MSNAPLPPIGTPSSRWPWLVPTTAVGAVAVIALAAWLYSAMRTTPAPANTHTATQRREFVSTSIGIRLQLDPGWTELHDSAFPSDHTFQSSSAKDCGCALYIIREANPESLSVSEWLNSSATKRDNYITKADVDRRKASADATTRQLAGTYEESSAAVAGETGLRQTYENDGGGYVRYLVGRGQYIYAITAWSDGYYFSDTSKQTQYDGGRLNTEVNAMVSSLMLP